MSICHICKKPATWEAHVRIDNTHSKTTYYCNEHSPQSKPKPITGLSSEQLGLKK